MKMEIFLGGQESMGEFMAWARKAGLKVKSERKAEKAKGMVLMVERVMAKRGAKAKVSKETIIEAIGAGKSLAEAAAEAGCSRAYVQKVIKQAKIHGKPQSETDEPTLFDVPPEETEDAEIAKKARQEYRKQKARAVGLMTDGGVTEEERSQILAGIAALGRIVGKDGVKEVSAAVRKELKKRSEHKI